MPTTPARDLPGPRPENQRKRRELRGPRQSLIGVLVVVAALAVAGGLALIIAPDRHLLRMIGLQTGAPVALFPGTGVVLVVVVGATQALAAVLLIGHHVRARAAALVAALILVVWGLLQMMLLDDITWFQIAVLGAGLLEVLLVAGCTPRKTPAHKNPMRLR